MKIWLDTASPKEIKASPATGITTNPLLYRHAGILDYPTWESEVLEAASGRPVSLEVFAGDLKGMRVQAERMLDLVPNVFVKIPVQTPEGQPTMKLVKDLERVNVTCCFSISHVIQACEADAAIVSVFAGRIADTGLDPEPLMHRAARICRRSQLLWASAREVLNVKHAERCGVDIITLPPVLYAKQALFGLNLDDYALTTVKEFTP